MKGFPFAVFICMFDGVHLPCFWKTVSGFFEFLLSIYNGVRYPSLYNESFSCRCDALVLVFVYFHPVFLVPVIKFTVIQASPGGYCRKSGPWDPLPGYNWCTCVVYFPWFALVCPATAAIAPENFRPQVSRFQRLVKNFKKKASESLYKFKKVLLLHPQ